MIAAKEHYLCLRFFVFFRVSEAMFCLALQGVMMVSSFPAGCVIHSPNVEQISADF